MISLQGLLASPEPKDPQDAEVAGMLLKNKEEFEHVAHEWAVKFAGATPKDKAEGSGGTTPEDLRRKAKEARNQEKDNKADAYARMSVLAIAAG